MSGPYGPHLMRLHSNDGTKYNLLSWTMFCVGTAFFLFSVTCGSLITPAQWVPHILVCFLISGAALVLAVYAVFKLVTFHKIKMSRSSNDDERTVDSDPAETSQSHLLSKTDPLPINGIDSIHSSRNPSYSPPTDSLIGLVSGESLRSRSWLYLASEASCRFRRSFSYDSSVSSMSPYSYGTFQQPDSTTDPTVVNEMSISSLVEHPVYAVPNKGASRNDLSARSRSGLVEDPNYHLPLNYESGLSSQVDAKKGPIQIATRSCLKNAGCYSHLNDGSYASPPQEFSNKYRQGERLGLVKESGHSNPLYGASNASSPQISSSKDQSKNPQRKQSGLVEDSGLSNPLYGASYASSPQISSSKDQSKNPQRKRSGLVEDSGLSNPLYGASCPQISSSKDSLENQQRKQSGLAKDSCLSNPLYGASSPQISSSKDPLENRQRKRPGLVEDSGHTNPLYAISMQTFSSKKQSQNLQSGRSGMVKNSDSSNPLDGASCAKSSRVSSSKDQSQNQQGAQSSLVEYPHKYPPSNEASYSKEHDSYHGEPTDQSPEYYYPLTSSLDKSSSSFDRTTVIENPFIWPKAYQSSKGKSENALNSSMKEPTQHYKKLKRKKVNSASKIYHSKLQKRHDKKLYLKCMHVRTVRIPQNFVGMCTYGPNEELKVFSIRRISSYSSEGSSPDEKSYMGPTRV